MGHVPVAAACVGLTLAGLTSTANAACPAAAGDCKELASTGSLGARIDLVILGDGYTEAEKDKFYSDAQKVSEGLLGSETYGAYAPVFNSWALFTPSAESGADDPSAGKFVSTAFDASYDTSGIDYLLAVNYSKALSEVNKRFPEKDVTLCIVNATAYGGSGGPVAVVSLHQSSLEIARHELGHTLAGLADEYTAPYPGYPDGDPEPNVASAAHLDPLKWASWLTPGVSIPTPISDAKSDHDPIGAYEGARYKETGVFRPAPDCLMRALDVTFCPVCSEAMVLEFSRLSLLIDAPSPASPGAIPGEGASVFSATIPALADLMITWSIDGQPTQTGSDKLAIDPSKLARRRPAHGRAEGV
ncbi:MAG: M64 family metallopeptidase [Polyangiaceae bacterium]